VDESEGGVRWSEFFAKAGIYSPVDYFAASLIKEKKQNKNLVVRNDIYIRLAELLLQLLFSTHLNPILHSGES